MIKVNLLPLDLQEKAKERFSVYWFGAFPVLVILVCIPFYFIKVKQIKEVQQKIVEVDAEIATYKGIEAQLAEAKQEVQLIETKINFIKQKKDIQSFWLNAIDRITAVLPADVWLSSISIQPNGMTSVVGNTYTYKSVANLLRTLQKTPFLSDVRMSSSSKSYGHGATPDSATFQMSFIYHGEEHTQQGQPSGTH